MMHRSPDSGGSEAPVDRTQARSRCPGAMGLVNLLALLLGIVPATLSYAQQIWFGPRMPFRSIKGEADSVDRLTNAKLNPFLSHSSLQCPHFVSSIHSYWYYGICLLDL